MTFSLGCSCGNEDHQNKGRDECFSYVVSNDGVHVCYRRNIMEYESSGEVQAGNDAQALVEYENIREKQSRSDLHVLVEHEDIGEEKSESNSQATVEDENSEEDRSESNSQALKEYKGIKPTALETKYTRSLLQRRGISPSRFHLSLSTLTGSTLVDLSGDQTGESNFTDSPCSENGNYEFIKQIGIDGEGIIHLMRTRSTGQLVARKTVEYAASAYAKPIEAAILQDILHNQHDNIIALHDFDPYQLQGARYYLEYCPGGDLHQLVNQYKKHHAFLPEPFIWHVYKQLLSALDFLHRGFDPRRPDTHRRGICHRDIKPSNIFLRPNPDPNSIYPDVVLADFGHASLDFATYDTAGTCAWQPPELPRHSPKGDVYSLGAVIHYLIHFQIPIAEMPDGMDDTESMYQAWVAAPKARMPILDFVEGYSEELICIMLMAMEADENKRKDSRRMLGFVSECVEMMFPEDEFLPARKCPLAGWAFDHMLAADEEEEEEEEEETGADQYFEMMDRFGYGEFPESSHSSSSSASVRSDWSTRVDRMSSGGCDISSISSLGETY